MPLILLPLLRFLIAVLSISIARARRPLAVVSHAVDAAMLAWLAASLARGTPVGWTLGSGSAGIGISMTGDRIGMTFAALAWGLSLAVNVYIWRDRLRPYFFLLVHLLVGACYAVSFTQDLFNAYLLFELLTLVSFLLVGYERRPRQIWASLRYLILSSFGMSVFLFGVGIVYAHCGTLDVGVLRPLIAASAGEPWVLLAAALLTTGIGVKAGVFLFSLWLPAAHARAMPAVSALLSGVVIKMGVLELFRLADVFPLRLPLIVLGSITGILGIAYAVTVHDIKKMLAFHTLSQIGYVLIGFGADTPVARLGALTYAVAHGLFKALLFLSAGDASAHVGSADDRTLTEHKARIPRATRIALAVGVLGIVGLPPLAGFDAKAILEDGLSSLGPRIIVWLLSIGTVLSFAKFVPFLFARSTVRAERPRACAYAWLGGLIVAFWPVSVLMTSVPLCLAALGGMHLIESLGSLLAGAGLYMLVRRRTLRLPQAIFRLEESPLIILLGFFLVFVLLFISGSAG